MKIRYCPYCKWEMGETLTGWFCYNCGHIEKKEDDIEGVNK